MKKGTVLKFLATGLVIFLFALALTACGASRDAAYPVVEPNSGSYYRGDDGVAEEAPAPVEDYASRRVEQGGVAAESEVRHVIRNGSMNLTVKDTQKTVKDIQGMVTAAGGIVSGSYIYEMKEGQYAANLTLRIPVSQFDQFLEQLQGLGKAAEIKTSEDDVTMQYLDLETRIKNLQSQEERLREILEMASTVEEVLQVESELGRVRGEIEVMTAQFTHLQDQVSYSTVNLYIQEEYIATQNISPAPFENLGTRMKEALVRSVNFIMSALATLLVVIMALFPVLLLLALILLVIWGLRNRARRKKTPPAGGTP